MSWRAIKSIHKPTQISSTRIEFSNSPREAIHQSFLLPISNWMNKNLYQLTMGRCIIKNMLQLPATSA